MLRSESEYTYSGRFDRNYELFESYVRDHRGVFEKKPDELTTIGSISHDNNAYFVSTKDCENHAQTFLAGFFSQESNRQAVIDMQNGKGEKEAFPSCISFVDVEIDGKKYCLVSMSGAYDDKREILELVQDYTERLPKNSDPEFILLDGVTKNISKLLSNLQGSATEDTFKTCAEKYSISALIKIFLKYGNKAKVTGSVNCSLYPYMLGARYGNRNGSVNGMVVHPFSSQERIHLDAKTFVTVLPCCSACKANKTSAQIAMKCGQHYGNNQLKYTSSPLVNSFKTRNSLTGSVEIGGSLTAYLEDSELPTLAEIDSEEEAYSSEEEVLLGGSDRSRLLDKERSSSVNEEDGGSANSPIAKNSKFPRLFSDASKPKLHRRKTVQPSPMVDEKGKGKKKTLDQFQSGIDYKTIEDAENLLISRFNIHLVTSKNVKAKGIKIVKDVDIDNTMKSFIDQHWEEFFQDIKSFEKLKEIFDGLVKVAYKSHDESQGWLCCKKTVRFVDFNTRAAAAYMRNFGKDKDKSDESFYPLYTQAIASLGKKLD